MREQEGAALVDSPYVVTANPRLIFDSTRPGQVTLTYDNLEITGDRGASPRVRVILDTDDGMIELTLEIQLHTPQNRIQNVILVG